MQRVFHKANIISLKRVALYPEIHNLSIILIITYATCCDTVDTVDVGNMKCDALPLKALSLQVCGIPKSTISS